MPHVLRLDGSGQRQGDLAKLLRGHAGTFIAKSLPYGESPTSVPNPFRAMMSYNTRMNTSYPHPISLDRMVRAVEKVRQRLLRAVKVLDDAKIPYAVIGGNAVAAWVSRIDEAAVRNTQDVDILVRRADFSRIKAAFEAAGFVYGTTMDVEFFLDEPNGKIRDAIHLLMAGEKVKPEYASPCPDVTDSERGEEFQVISLEALVEMKLNSYRDKDKTHLRDMIEIGLIDGTWPVRFPPTLADRLQQLLDDPNG